jgi:hypothetical protein
MPRFQYSRTAAISALVFAALLLPAVAQDRDSEQPAKDTAQEKPAKPPKPYGGGTPLDVILHNKLWETPPEPKDFVRENRRPVDELNYQPTVGSEPERPKTRSNDELKALQSELEGAETRNSVAAGGKKAGKPDAAVRSKSHAAARKAKPAEPGKGD